MSGGWIEKITGSLEEKKQYRQYQARKKTLTADYRTAIDALERYLTYFGAITRGDVIVRMLEDLLELFEVAEADGTPVRGIVGRDPVEFIEDFLTNYAEGQWINKERTRLVDAIDAIDGVTGNQPRS